MAAHRLGRIPNLSVGTGSVGGKEERKEEGKKREKKERRKTVCSAALVTVSR